MSGHFYGGIPVEEVDFEKEFDKELNELENMIEMIKNKRVNSNKFNYHFWTLKLNRANKDIQLGTVTLD